jgi:hypothetical protein
MTQNQRELAETVFERNERREAEINDAMKQEHARREAAVKNMYRLRALRLEISLRRAVENCRRVLTGEAPLHLIGLDERLM